MELQIGTFQSTLPVWGATKTPFFAHARGLISIHAPRVGSDYDWMLTEQYVNISIHAPRVGSDTLNLFSRSKD